MPDGSDAGDTRRPHGELVADVLAVLWAAPEPLTAAQVKDALGGRLARTTVTTILTRMHEKGTLRRERAGRGFVYSPVHDAAGLTAERMHRELHRDPHPGLVLERFVSALSPDDEQVLRRLLRSAGATSEEDAG
ncbi:BlaI/MecI/CopY family transcriptional regulator [Kitasatospora sp. NPDC094015]|uniref:BlaI/MecI/CopY family transcriptional regulator n=1 Tax=Kitasatospora sp. NPDC094015 TaxID=3155205 RepID=UPI003330B712